MMGVVPYVSSCADGVLMSLNVGLLLTICICFREAVKYKWQRSCCSEQDMQHNVQYFNCAYMALCLCSITLGIDACRLWGLWVYLRYIEFKQAVIILCCDRHVLCVAA